MGTFRLYSLKDNTNFLAFSYGQEYTDCISVRRCQPLKMGPHIYWNCVYFITLARTKSMESILILVKTKPCLLFGLPYEVNVSSFMTLAQTKTTSTDLTHGQTKPMPTFLTYNSCNPKTQFNFFTPMQSKPTCTLLD